MAEVWADNREQTTMTALCDNGIESPEVAEEYGLEAVPKNVQQHF